jgi:metallo-beta-lactamase class B
MMAQASRDSRRRLVPAGILALLILALGTVAVAGRGAAAQDDRIAAARAAAQPDYTFVFDSTCGLIRPAATVNTGPAPRPVPTDRSTWHLEPVKVFDNLYFVGQAEYSAWAITTSAGIIVLDALFDYSVEDEVIGGLTKLGLDPNAIKYVVISHGHGDHVGGARILQDRGARILMGAEDWDLLERTKTGYAKPRKDMVVTDGQKLTLGDTTLTLYLTPGHTPATVSALFPVRDGKATHVAAFWGGTAFNWVLRPETYVTPSRPADFWFTTYARSVQRFQDLAKRARADVLVSNHTKYDSTTRKTLALRSRVPGGPHPWVIGPASLQRFFTVAEECAKAGLSAPPS